MELWTQIVASPRPMAQRAHGLNKIIRPAARYVGPLPDMDIY
jgi:citrate synthase